MSSIKIIDSKKERLVSTGELQLVVNAVITDGDKQIPINRGFPLTESKESITAELQKALALYEEEKARSVENADAEEAEAAADETIEGLKDLEITS